MISYPQFINPSDILTSFGITGLQAYHDSMGSFSVGFMVRSRCATRRNGPLGLGRLPPVFEVAIEMLLHSRDPIKQPRICSDSAICNFRTAFSYHLRQAIELGH